MVGQGGTANAGTGGSAASAGAGSGGSSGSSGGSAGSAGSLSAGASWTRQFGTDASDEACCVGVDAQGSVVVLASVQATEGTVARKYDARGTLLWNLASEERLVALAVHPGGDVFAAGSIEGDLPGQTGSGQSDALVRSYDADGNQRFARQFGTSGLDGALALNVDERGHAFVLWSSAVKVENTHVVLSELDADGNQLSTVPIGDGNGFLTSSVDRHGNVFAVSGSGDYFLRKYDSQGQELWTTPVGGVPTSVSPTDDGSVLVAGMSSESPSSLAKYDAAGDLVFGTDFGGADDFSTLSAAAPEGNAFVAGTTINGPISSYDLFVRRFDAAGAELGSWPLATDAYDAVSAIVADASGALLIVGETDGTLPGQVSSGRRDAFVARLVP